LKHKKLFEIGNNIWPGEYYPGYPVRVALPSGLYMVTAYGTTAAARRRSRVELWNKQNQISHGTVDPAVEGKLIYGCATTQAAAEKWLGDPRLAPVTAKLKDNPAIETADLERMAVGWPDGQNQPEAFFYLKGGGGRPEDDEPIQHGLSIRLRIQFERARIEKLLLNGRRMEKSETDGYLHWVARGWTYFQINIPPERLKKDELFLITCEYDPGEKRPRWRPGIPGPA
jgi:hypothetical protein